MRMPVRTDEEILEDSASPQHRMDSRVRPDYDAKKWDLGMVRYRKCEVSMQTAVADDSEKAAMFPLPTNPFFASPRRRTRLYWSMLESA